MGDATALQSKQQAGYSAEPQDGKAPNDVERRAPSKFVRQAENKRGATRPRA